MKQTNNAIKFLLAQYRAIFKHAYLKGLVSAAVLTTGLAAGAANAATFTDWQNATSSDLTVASGDTGAFQATASGTHTINSGLIFSAENAAEATTDNLITTSASGTTNIESAGDLVLNKNVGLSVGGVNTNTSKYTLGVSFQNITVDNAALDVVASSASGSGTVTLQAAQDVIVTGESAVVSVTAATSGSSTLQAKTISADNGATLSLTAGDATHNAVLSGESIEISDAILKLDSSASGDALIQGGNLVLNNNALMLTSSGTSNKVEVDNFVLESDAFKVISGTGTQEIFAGHSGLVNGNVLVGAANQWLITAKHEENEENFNDKDTDNKYQSGTDDVVGNLTFASGANIQIGGAIRLAKGTLTIEDGVQLHSLAEARGDAAGAIVVSNDGGVAGDEKPTLVIDSDVLKDFLSSGDSYQAIQKNSSGNNYELGDGTTTDLQGTLLLQSGGVVTFSDAVDLSDFAFTSGSTADQATAGTITVGPNGGTIKGTDVTVSKAFKDASDKNLTADTPLTVKADSLTLGDNTATGLTGLSGSGFTKFSATKELNLKVANDGYFKIDNVGGANTLTNSNSNVVGQVNGNLDFAAASNFTDSALKVKGQWSINDNLRFTTTSATKPTVFVGAYRTDWTSGAYDTHVTINGSIVNNLANGAYSSILVKDYVNSGSEMASNNYAILDITKANLETTYVGNPGLVALNAGINGTLQLTGSQLETILDRNNGFTIGAADLGTVEVTTAVTGEHDFSHFIKTGPTDGKDLVGNVVFGNGVLDVNGNLSLYTGDRNNASTASTALDIGEGTIKSTVLTLTNYEVKGTGDKATAADTQIAAGNLEVSEGLVVNKSNNLLLGNGTDAASIVLNTVTFNRDGSVSTNGTGGAITFADATNGGTIKVASGSSIEATTGNWSTAADIEVSGNGALVVGIVEDDYASASADVKKAVSDYIQNAIDNGTYVAQFKGDNFKATGTATDPVIEINQQSLATLNTIQIADGNTADINGHLVIEGKEISGIAKEDLSKDPAYVNMESGADSTYSSTTAGIDLGASTYNVNGAGAVLEFSNLATNALIDLVGETDAGADGSKIVINKGGIDEATFNVENFGQLKFNFDDGTKLSTDDVKFLITDLGVGKNTSSGYLNLGNADLGLNIQTAENGTTFITWNDVKDFVNVIGSQATTDALKASLVKDIASNEAVKGHYGALSVDVSKGGSNQLTINGPLSLHNAAAFDNKFVFNQSTGEALAVRLSNGASLLLENGGEIGAVTGNDTYTGNYGENSLTTAGSGTTVINGSVTKINEFNVGNDTTVKGDVSVNELYATSDLTVGTADQAGAITINGGVVSTGATVNAGSLKVANTINGADNIDSLLVMGDVNLTGELNVTSGSTLEIMDGSVSAKDLVLDTTSEIFVGYKPVANAVDDPLTEELDETKTYNGHLEITGSAVFNGGAVVLDPEYSKAASTFSINNLSGAATDYAAGVLDGSIFVGQNSVQGIGSANTAELMDAVSKYMSDNKSMSDELSAVLYLGKSFTIDSTKGSLILSNMSAEDFKEYYDKNDGVTAPVLDTDAEPALANTLFLGDKTAILVDADVVTAADTSRTNTTAIVGFDGAKGTVIADGGDIIIGGEVRASTYQVFGNADIKYIDGSAYAAVTDKTAAHFDDNINVATENEFLLGVVADDGTVTLGINPEGRAIMAGASDPVYTTLVAYAQGYNGDNAEDESAKLYDGYTTGTDANGATTQVKDYAYNNYVLQYAISTGNGAAAEQVARLGVYGGSVQAALTAGATTYDAVSARMGVGAQTGSITFADNGQGASLWVTPIYKNHDSDGFEAQGLSYGADMDMYGVALGGDYTLGNGMRVGAAFNVGSGDADGQGAGAGVSNDFDYYGFTVYGGYTMDKLSVVADVSYTVVDNDVEGNNGYGKVSSSLDTSNISFGVTGQYTFNFNAVDVVPHAGLRYTYIDMDDYNVKDVDGDEVARYAGDSMSVFSIPVGVTFSKEIVSGEWTVKPAFDLTLTANVGDDSIDGAVTWNGVDNLKTNLESEVIDSFTYGATLGVSAKTGNFSMGFGVNYTGASSADEYGISANARFVF